jgi:hypothetical protein
MRLKKTQNMVWRRELYISKSKEASGILVLAESQPNKWK